MARGANSTDAGTSSCSQSGSLRAAATAVSRRRGDRPPRKGILREYDWAHRCEGSGRDPEVDQGSSEPAPRG